MDELTGHILGQLDLGILRMGAVQEHDVAEHLRDLAARLGGELVGDFLAIEPGGLADLHLDQLVIGESLIDCADEPFVDAVLADLHEGAQVVGECTKMAALLTGEHGAL